MELYLDLQDQIGAGKTTTIEMITGVLNIDAGDILIDGKSIINDSLEAKKNFGFVPDTPDVFEKLTGLEYLNFIGDVYEVPSKIRLERIEKLERVSNPQSGKLATNLTLKKALVDLKGKTYKEVEKVTE